MKKINDRVILADDIPNWECCFNCVFAHQRSGRYICHLKWYIKKYVENEKTKFLNPAFRVRTTDSCEYLITRPKFATELYGNAVILYPFQKHGVKKFSSTELFKLVYEPQLRSLQKKLGLKILPKFKLGYSWTFSSSGKHALIRNQLCNNGVRKGKFTCNHCKKKFYYDEVEIHHIMERTHKGSDTTANLMALCLWCHDLETWKLVTGNTNITTELRWRKLIESRFKLWENRKEGSENKAKWIERRIDHYKNFEVDKDKEVELTKTIIDNLNKREQVLTKVEKFIKRCNHKIIFWGKYEQKTRKWIYKKKTYGMTQKVSTIDKFLKKF